MNGNPEHSEKTTEPAQQAENPEWNILAIKPLERLYRLFGQTTQQSRNKQIPCEEGVGDVRRPIHVRTKRAQLLKELQSTPAEERNRRRQILKKAHAADIVSGQFLKQGTVQAVLEGGAQATARYARVRPAEGQEAEDKPLIVLIPGISNDLASVNTLGEEFALQGREALVIGNPDSQMGSVNEAFASAVEEDKGLGPHAAFFQKALEQLVPPGSDIELWGFSNGAPVIGEMLSGNPELSERVKRAVLLNPAASTDMRKPERSGLLGRIRNALTPDPIMMRGIAAEARSLAGSGRLSSFPLIAGRTSSEPRQQKKYKKRIFNALLERLRTPTKAWSSMRVSEDGEIVVVVSDHDEMTRCYDGFSENENLPNAQMKRVITLQGGHNAPLLQPENLVEQVGV